MEGALAAHNSRGAGTDTRVGALVLSAAVLMTQLGLVTGTVGNVSARFGDQMLITPTRRYYDELAAADVVVVDLGDLQAPVDELASREWRLHAAVYAVRPDVNAIAHTHSPYAVARSFQPEPLTFQTEEADYFDLGTLPVAPYAPAGTVEFAESAAQRLGAGRGMLLARHGVLAVSDTARNAVELAATIERQAQVQWLILNAPPPPGRATPDMQTRSA